MPLDPFHSKDMKFIPAIFFPLFLLVRVQAAFRKTPGRNKVSLVPWHSRTLFF